MAPNNKKVNNDEITLKEASSKLDISETTIKKYLKDFDLSTQKGSNSKTLISNETFQALSEIVKLRSNGLSIQEIKELKSQKPSKNILDEIDETKEEIKLKESHESKEDILESDEVSTDKEKEEDVEDQTEDGTCELDEEEDSEEHLQQSLKEGQRPEEGITIRRKRLFNYRYVERQIANDSRRVGSLRQRLKNSNLSVQERLFIEEALERRILFLDGWKHILRWTSK